MGVSEALKARLQTEEAKRSELRAKLTAATPREPSSAGRQVSKAQVLNLLENVSQVARTAPRRAGEILATVIEPVVLRPVEKGYQGDVWLRNDPAAMRAAGYAISVVAGACKGAGQRLRHLPLLRVYSASEYLRLVGQRRNPRDRPWSAQ